MSWTSGEWPASEAALTAGRALLRSTAGPVVVACDHDVDGLASGVLVERALERTGLQVEVVPVTRGAHVHEPGYRAQLARRAAALYVVTDMGSRAEPIALSAPVLVIDHHDADAFPPDAVVVSSARRLPVAPTSYLAYALLEQLVRSDDLAWLALLGSAADLGAAASFGVLPALRELHRAKDVSESIALLNAARRSAEHDVATALRVLRAASSPRDIATANTPDVERLRTLRAEVAAEVKRCARVPPRIHGETAVIRIRSRAQVHPLVAVRWTSRLHDKIVLVANEDFLPGRVSFVLRSARKMDLIAWLRALELEDVGPDYARGHPAATGGNLSPEQFERLLSALQRSS